MENRKRVIVVGAGSAGLMAAIAAARNGAQVTVLEAMDRPGKKLLLTGNGRCNLTNMDPNLPEAYYGSGAKLASEIVQNFDAQAVRSFFEELGLLTSEKNGYVYPYTGQSVSVLETLLAEVRRLKIKLKFTEKVQAVTWEDDQWLVHTATWQYPADAVILACGSCAAPATGSDGSGYELAKSLHHTIVVPSPALTPVLCQTRFLPALVGVRCRAEVTLWELQNNLKMDSQHRAQMAARMIKKETGELQWTKYGVSGIVVFQLSRFISSAKEMKNLYLTVDLLPDFTETEVLELLKKRASDLGDEKLNVLLAGLLNEKLIPVILDLSGIASKKYSCRKLLPGHLEVLVQQIKCMKLPVNGTKSFDTAQICAGGVQAEELTGNLESRRYSGIYCVGELVDVDGPCGGYNLQWAWSSGYCAGCHAALVK